MTSWTVCAFNVVHMSTPAVITQSAPAASKRLRLLDALRGFAIIGTLASNIWIFTAAGSEGSVMHQTGAATFGDPLEFIFRLWSNGKFLSTLTILFGVGIAIQYRSAQRRGLRWPGRYKWRTAFLFVEGTVHFIFIFAFDVLMGYAVTALVVAWLLNRSRRFRQVIAATALALHLVIVAGCTAAMMQGQASRSAAQADVDLFASGSWFAQIHFRLDHFLAFRSEPILMFPLLVLLFMSGVALFRSGAFGTNATAERIRARMMVWGFGIGAPLNLATMLGGEKLFFMDRYLSAPVLAIGFIGAAGWLTQRFPNAALVRGLSNLGRTALSGYVIQNALAAVCCYGFGLGLTARMAGYGSWWAVALWAAISAFLVCGASWWLRHFSAGPLETLQKRVLR